MKFVMMKNNKHLSLNIRREHYENMIHFSLLTIVTKINKTDNKQEFDNKQKFVLVKNTSLTNT